MTLRDRLSKLFDVGLQGLSPREGKHVVLGEGPDAIVTYLAKSEDGVTASVRGQDTEWSLSSPDVEVVRHGFVRAVAEAYLKKAAGDEHKVEEMKNPGKIGVPEKADADPRTVSPGVDPFEADVAIEAERMGVKVKGLGKVRDAAKKALRFKKVSRYDRKKGESLGKNGDRLSSIRSAERKLRRQKFVAAGNEYKNASLPMKVFYGADRLAERALGPSPRSVSHQNPLNRVDEFRAPKSKLGKGQMPGGAAMAKQPAQPTPPTGPGKPKAAQQAQSAATGMNGKQGPKAPATPKPPKSAQPKASPDMNPPKVQKSEGRQLIGSAPSKEHINKLLDQYFLSSTKLHPSSDGTYEVHNKKGKIDGISVRERKGRWRAELHTAPVKKSESFSIEPHEARTPCPQCGTPEFKKSESGRYEFTPCGCFASESKRFVTLTKSEDGKLKLTFSPKADPEAKRIFLLTLKTIGLAARRFGQED